MKKGIIIGSRGFIGSHFCKALPYALKVDRTQIDLSNPKIEFSTEGYEFALITAGIGNPRKCEQDPQFSYKCNVLGTLKLGEELIKRGIVPVFFSSDYVFNDHLQLAPLNAYGKQKLELEKKALALDALVVRLSKVYGLQKGDGTLFDEMAASLMYEKKVKAASDQVFAPIFIGDVVTQVLQLLEKGVTGITDMVGPRYASRFEMACALARKLKGGVSLIEEIKLDTLNDGVLRPRFLKLSSSSPALSWEDGVDTMVQAYAN
jgi:dTDP-4-dehydrorhamnose reductase